MNKKQLLQQYVDTGIPLPEYQVRSLPNDLLTTYIRKRLIATESGMGVLSDYEFDQSTPEQREQYVNTGIQLSKYQVRSLPENLKNTYLSKRLIAAENYLGDLEDYEIKLWTLDQRFEIVMEKPNLSYIISEKEYKKLTLDQRFQYVMKEPGDHHIISMKEYELLTPDQRWKFALKMGLRKYGYNECPPALYMLLTPEQKFQYMMERLKKGYGTHYGEFYLLTPKHRFQYAMTRKKSLTFSMFELLTPDQRFQYVMKRVEDGYGIETRQFELLTPEQQKIFKDKGGKIS